MPIPVPMAAAIYFIAWWIVLFAVLPWGVRSQGEGGAVVPGSDPGAPAVPHLLAKVIWTTALAGVVLLVVLAMFAYL